MAEEKGNLPSPRTEWPSHPGKEQLKVQVKVQEQEQPATDSASESSSPKVHVQSPDEEKREEILVKWGGKEDKENPLNWSGPFKAWITFQLCMCVFSASLAASFISPGNKAIAEYVGLSENMMVLDISLYVIGFAFGPIFWGPFSEVWGRRWSMLPPMTCLGIFSIGTALSRNAPAIFITRFFAGLFGSAPVSNVNAALGDIYTREARGVAVAVYSIFIVFGTDLGPVVGSATMLNSHMSWRWTAYMTAFVSFAVVAMVTLGMPETYPPVLLKRKAQRLRKETGDDRYYHPHERIQVDVKSIITKQLSRPLKMLLTEPMVTCIAFYASFVYAILFITIQAFPIVFQELRGWNPITASMSFMAMFIGCVCALVVNIGNQPRYIRISRAANGRPVPEARLAPLAIGAVCMVIGLFWFGWNAEPKYHWVLPCIAIMFIGAGFNIIFQQCLNYLVDVYGLYGASAVAANTFLRSVMAAGLPLGVRPMIENLGPGPAMSILGAIAALMLPVPFFLMKYGLALRKRSTFAPVLD